MVTCGKRREDGSHLDFTSRYRKESNVENRFEGEPPVLGAAFPF